MKLARITGPKQCEIVERPLPTVAENYCLIKNLAAPMCTEFHGYRDGKVDEVLGHEAAGEIVDIARSGRFKIGDRVVVMPQNPCGRCDLCLSGNYIFCSSPRDPAIINGCTQGRATFAQYVVQQDWMLLAVPDDIGIDHASMACCALGPSFNAVGAMNVSSTDTVLITGLGPVGLGALINARVRGARVIGVDSNPWRSNMACIMGAETVLDSNDPDVHRKILELTSGLGADKSIEASSSECAPAFLVQATRACGEITTIGWGGPINARDLTAKGITFRGAWHWNHLRYGREMMETIRRATPLLDILITHKYPLSKVQDAWETQLTGMSGKVLLQPWNCA